MRTDLPVMSLFASLLDAHQKAKTNPNLEFFDPQVKDRFYIYLEYMQGRSHWAFRGGVFVWLV